MSQPARVVLKDIADQLGLSKATVSMALRSSPRISESTRERVRKMADTLGYQPNPLVSAFLSQNPRHRNRAVYLSYVITETRIDEAINRPYGREVYQGLQQRAKEMGFHLEPVAVPEHASVERIFAILRNRGIDGLVLAPFQDPRSSLDPALFEPFAVVAIGQSLAEPHVHRLATDNSLNMLRLMEHVYARGYRRIGLVVHPGDDTRNLHSWSQSWIGFLYRHRLPSKGLLFEEPRPFKDTIELKRWIERARPDCIILSDQWNYWLLKEYYGPLDPDQLGVACVDIKGSERSVSGYLSAAENIGRGAIEMLAALINRNERGIPKKPQRILIEGDYNPGETLRAPPESRA